MRRVLTCILILAILAMPFVPVPNVDQVAYAQESSSATTTDSLNLRADATTSSRVLVVMPRGASVVVRGAAKNGFLPLTYRGTDGWAHRDYLSVPKPSGVAGQAGTVTEALNLRMGPSSAHKTILVLPAGAKLTVTGTSSNGYLAVTYGGYTGFAHGNWITTGSKPLAVVPAPTTPGTAGSGKVTESLNFRTGANTTSSIIAVLPAGATVSLTGKASGDFLQLTYNGRTGWAHKNWIKTGSATTTPAPAPSQPKPTPKPPVTVVSGPAKVTEDLNLRSQANTSSSIITVLRAGSNVTLTGEVSGVFYKLTFSGKTGWAHRDWIEVGKADVIASNTAVTTDAVVLRDGPATNYTRILVLPVGARVALTGQQSNGFHSVSYNGKSGWAFSTYLNMDSAGKNLPVVPPGSVQSPKDGYAPIKSNQGFHYTNSIVGTTRGTPEQAIEYSIRAKAVNQPDVELYIYEIYRLAPQLGFDPALIIAQSAHETNAWKSKWWEERLNPAGLGINDDPSTHPYSAKFPNGTIAARAQLAHMHAEVYGNRRALPTELQGVDVTYERVMQAGWAGTVVTLEDLSGTWATDPDYGFKIARTASYIFG